MERQRNFSQWTEQEKPWKTNNKTDNLYDQELKGLVIKILTELGKRTDVHIEHFNSELENIEKSNQKYSTSIIN